MKKTKTIQVPAKPATTREVSVYSCDCCGKESSSGLDFKHCTICRRMICRGARGCTKSDPLDSSDYPDPYCPTCYQLKFKKYAGQISDIHDKYYDDLEEMDSIIRRESLGE